jgi:hypothetical protein
MGRSSLLSPSLLADLYPRSGRLDDFVEAPLSEDARRVAEILLLSGPTSTSALREVLGMEGKKGQSHFSSAMAELGRHLVVTNYGVEDRGGAWPAAMLELTTRAFSLPGRRRSHAAAHLSAAERFLGTVLWAEADGLAGAFRWPRPEARRCLEALVRRGLAVPEASGYAVPPRRRRSRPRS